MKNLTTIGLCALLAVPANAQDNCATAVPVTLGSYVVTAVNGTQPPAPICAQNGGAPTAGEWYVFTATHDTTIRISSDLPGNNGVDTRVHVYTGGCATLTCHAGDDDSGTGYTSVCTFNVLMGVSYLIAWDNNWSSLGFTFTVSEAPAAPPPPTGNFTAVAVPTTGMAYCVVDMDADGLDDAVDVTATNIRVHYQLTGGGFNTVNYATTPADQTPYWSMCAGDLDKNGYNDLVYAGGGITLMMANASGTAYTETSFPEYIFCQRSNTVDINNDGHLDVFSCHDVEPNVYYLNDGSNNFTYYQGGLGDTPDGGNYGSIWIDYDNDRDIDMFIAKCRGAGSPASIDQMHQNDGNGNYTEVAASLNLTDYHQSWSSAWGDFDNDGDLDVLIGASSFTGGGHKLMRNDGTTFTNVTPGSGYDLFNGTSIEFVTHDFDNDGYLDVLGGGGMMRNNGNMTFTQISAQPGNGPIGDLNNDGFLDVQNGGTVWMNNGNANNWLKVRTIGTASNANGIGARVRIVSALGAQIREVRSGDGFRYMSSLNTHFGLGSDTGIDSLIVLWPSGLTSVVVAPPINSTITVTEDLATGIASVPGLSLGVFPNPATEVLRLNGTSEVNGRTARVIDIAGQVVLVDRITNGTLDIAGLKPGAYVLEVMSADGMQQVKFMKE
ncbi:MAG: VCBS repeat-containing protein [Flavobacteriales bacterium]|nr:VCBS repeat-containing protein [Flavobacteriales bacterium]